MSESAQIRPLHAILVAFQSGATSLPDIQRLTGLTADVVRAGVDHLVRLGQIEAKELSIGCPSGGCGSCASGTADGQAACGASGPSTKRRGPVLVTLRVKPRAERE